MKVLIQRVKYASCKVDNVITGSIEKGYMILVGFSINDAKEVINKMVKKVLDLRIFEDNNDKMNLNIKQVDGSILSISQFTLYANTSHGARPSFVDAMPKDKAIEFYEIFNEELRKYIHVETGVFGAHMEIELLNDGPVTVEIEL